MFRCEVEMSSRRCSMFLLTTILVACCQVLAFAGSIKFKDASAIRTGMRPLTLATGDLRGVGRIDVVVANNDSSSIGVNLNDGRGNFTVTRYPTPERPAMVAVGDLNLDGTPDIAVTHSKGVSIFLGNGDGTFGAERIYRASPNHTSLFHDLVGLAIADFNGDGYPDLIATDDLNETANLLINDGSGGFKFAYSMAQEGTPVGVVVGDFNRDGVMDFVTSDRIGATIDVSIGNGDGTFHRFVSYQTSIAPWTAVAGDINGDGILDLLVPDLSGVDILLGNGDGTFQPIINCPAPFGTGLAVADFNGDGNLDLILTTTAGVDFIPGNGDATFGPGLIYAAGSFPAVAVTADFNNDGIVDAMVPNWNSDNLTAFLGRGNGEFFGAPTYAITQTSGSFTTGDVDGDGFPDVLVDTGANGVLVYLGSRDGTLQAPLEESLEGPSPRTMALADVNNDRKLDLVVNNIAFSEVGVSVGNGDGTFQAQSFYPTNSGASGVTVADFNGDGSVDLAVPGANVINILLGRGDGTFGSAISYSVGNSPQSIAVGDFDGNGTLDIAVANVGDETLSILLGKSNGTFLAARTFKTNSSPGRLVAVDLNHDGKLDLVLGTNGQNFIQILLGKGNGTFNAPVKLLTSPLTVEVAALDVDGDGNIDLASVDENEITVYAGNGDGSFQPGKTFFGGNTPLYLRVADLNSDGRPDLIALGGNGFAGGVNGLAILLNSSEH